MNLSYWIKVFYDINYVIKTKLYKYKVGELRISLMFSNFFSKPCPSDEVYLCTVSEQVAQRVSYRWVLVCPFSSSVISAVYYNNSLLMCCKSKTYQDSFYCFF